MAHRSAIRSELVHLDVFQTLRAACARNSPWHAAVSVVVLAVGRGWGQTQLSRWR
eukprot:SAG31_NODE_4988_length_2818_cov_9.534020_3_plen_55_part_00